MENFYNLITDVLIDKNISIKELEEKNVLAKTQIYDFKNFIPSTKTMINIANYLKVSIDYIIGNTDINNFRPYKTEQSNFYEIINNLIKSYNFSQRQFCKEGGFSKGDFSKWEKGVEPKFSTLLKISNFLNCPVDDLLETEKII